MAVEDTASFDYVVLLGDYFDPPNREDATLKQVERVAYTILGFKEILGDKLHLLCGNHDLPYYALRPACGTGTSRPNRMIGEWLEVTTMARADVINELWNESF